MVGFLTVQDPNLSPGALAGLCFFEINHFSAHLLLFQKLTGVILRLATGDMAAAGSVSIVNAVYHKLLACWGCFPEHADPQSETWRAIKLPFL